MIVVWVRLTHRNEANVPPLVLPEADAADFGRGTRQDFAVFATVRVTSTNTETKSHELEDRNTCIVGETKQYRRILKGIEGILPVPTNDAPVVIAEASIEVKRAALGRPGVGRADGDRDPVDVELQVLAS